MAAIAPIAGQASAVARARRDVSLDLLRTALVLLVVVHHAALGYHPYATPQEAMSSTSLWWTAFPVVDPRRCPGTEIVVAYNDLFFMSLLFLISGVFAWPSLERKGAARFARDRLVRLGIPFAVAAAILGPLAYAPTYLASDPAPHLAGFWHAWRALGFWPAGPVWFLWVLLVFDLVGAATYALAPGFGAKLGELAARVEQRPARGVAWLLLASALAYMPLALVLGPSVWWRSGPFTFQTSRILHYAVYFVAGIGLGARGLGAGWLAADGELARGWARWILPATVSVGFALAVLAASLSGPGPVLSVLGAVAFVVSCATISAAWLAVFLRFAHSTGPARESLRANAYGLYVVHFACVTWLQLLLLDVDLPAVVKLGVVIAGTVAIGWGVTAALRRIPMVAKVL